MKPIDVAAGLVFHSGRLLITQRHSHDHLGDLWEFPGGKVEPDETFEKCLRRELNEELGIDVEVGSLLESVTHSYPEKTIRLQFYVCSLTKGEAAPLGCQAVAWITASELDQYLFPAADAQLLIKLKGLPGLWK
ncbi:MAG: 8-oxo-dGTP diphosphatase MutT [Verrucomicrobiota bacterium]|nr:8-oxo-dGTP diphosphatase MutT [Verrucomicrobiota bacterium]